MAAGACGSSAPRPITTALLSLPTDGPGRLLAFVPPDAELIVELDVARLRNNPALGQLARQLIDSDVPLAPQTSLPPGIPTSLRGVDAIVLASYHVGGADAQTLTLLQAAPGQTVAGVIVAPGIVAVGPENLAASAVLLGAKPTLQNQLSPALATARQRATLVGSQGAVLRIAAHLAPAVARDLRLPVDVAAWSDVVDDAVLIVACPKQDAPAMQQRVKHAARLPLLGVLGLAPSLVDAALQPMGAWSRVVVVVPPNRLRRVVQRASAALGKPRAAVPQSSQGVAP